MIRNSLYALGTICVVIIALHSHAQAQLNNRPFSFRYNTFSNTGISIGGREAILNEKLFGIRPHNMQRDSNGILLDVIKGPGGAALARDPVTGRIAPQYRGIRWTDAGARVDYFTPSPTAQYYLHNTPTLSGEVINMWTSSVTDLDGK